MKNELKPCPFCGGNKITVHTISPYVERLTDGFWATCKSCHSFGPPGNTKEEAVVAWNRRTEQPAPYRDDDFEPLAHCMFPND